MKKHNMGLVAMDQKLNGLEENIRVGVLTSVNATIQNHAEQERKTQNGAYCWTYRSNDASFGGNELRVSEC